MKTTRSLLAVALLASLARADLLPPMQDTSSSKGNLTPVTGKAGSLGVSATRKAFVRFPLDSLPEDVQPADIANARLRIYLPRVKTPGDINVNTVTSAWDEVSKAPEPTVSGSPIAMFPAAMVAKKKFLEVDVTATVRAWRAAPATNFGFAFLAASPAGVTIGAKEGSGSGYPCELEVQIDRATVVGDGSIGTLQLADGSVTTPKLADGAVSAVKLGAGAAQKNLDAGVPVGLGLGGAAARATLELGGGPSFFAPRQLTVLRDGVGGFSRLASPRSIAISGTTAVVAAISDSAVTVLDISNPAQPVLKAELVDGSGGFNELAGVHRVSMSGSLAFIAEEFDTAVTIVDLADPASPVLKAVLKSGVGGYNFGSRITDVAVSGDLLAITGEVGGDDVTFVDISDPAAPARVSALRDGEDGFNRLFAASGVALTTLPGLGLHAIVTAGFDNAVTIIDVNDPANPVLRAELVDGVGGFDGLDSADGVSAEGTLIAVSGFFFDAVSLIDISTPTAPVLRAELRDGVDGFNRLDGPTFPTLAGGRLYIPGRNEEALTILDVSNPAAPVLLAELVDGAGGFDGLAFDQNLNVAVTPAGHVFVPASGESAVSVIETQPQVSLAVQQRMGIGTATPGAELEVVGTAKATAFSGDGSALTNLNAANLGTGSVNNTELGFLDGVTSSVQTQLGGKVSKAGDTMTGALTLPANGLTVGGTQLVASGGMVGIGTAATPLGLLDVAGGTSASSALWVKSSDTVSNQGGLIQHQGSTYAFKQSVVNSDTSGAARLHFDLVEVANPNTRTKPNILVLGGNGFVGIGGTASYPLEVFGSVGNSVTGGGAASYWDGASAPHADTGTTQFSVSCEQGVRAPRFFASSDRRIKDIVALTDGASALASIEALKVTDYRLKDRVAHGEQVQRGLIAQEVREQMPEAVTMNRGAVPDIYEAAKSFSVDAAREQITVSLEAAHTLKAGERVRLVTDDGVSEVTVAEVRDSHTFVAGPWKKAVARVFVYGREVDDFLAVDYNRIFTTGIAALQQLKKEKDAEIADLRARLERLEQVLTK